MQCDHPSNKKLGGVCICYKNCLPLRITHSSYLNERVRFEVMTDDKICYFITYSSPSKSWNQLESFKENPEVNLESALQNNGNICWFDIHFRNHPFSMYAKFSKKLPFFNPWYAQARVCVMGKKSSFFEKFCVHTKWKTLVKVIIRHNFLEGRDFYKIS